MNIHFYCYDDVNNPRCGGGGAYRDLSIHKVLAAQGHCIHFYTGNFSGAQDSDGPNFHYRHLGMRNNYALSRISFALLATLHSLFVKTDIIVIQYSIYAPVLTFLFRPKKTIVQFFHITGKEVFTKYGLFGMFPHMAEKIALNCATNYLTLTDSMSEDFKKRRPHINTVAAYVSFDTSMLSQDTSDDEQYILCFGRIDIRMKGIDTLIDAFEKIAGNFPGYRLIVAGRGKETAINWVHERIRTSPFAQRIQCIVNPPDSEKKKLFHAATFVCMPSRFEGWNIAAIEAAASSKATVGTRIHGLRDAIRDGKTGLLAEPGNSDALGTTMAHLLTDEPLRHELGKNGYEWALQFTLERIAGIQENFYRHITNINNSRR